MNYTKGPWKFAIYGDLEAETHDVLRVSNDGEIVCDNPADAKLIEAAPELLEALHEALPFIEDDTGAYKHSYVEKVRNRVLKAIKKAEGGE